jgi:hypothetical protein
MRYDDAMMYDTQYVRSGQLGIDGGMEGDANTPHLQTVALHNPEDSCESKCPVLYGLALNLGR